MTILLTGFEPFGKLQANPSQCVVDELRTHVRLRDGIDLVAEVLPTAYEAAGRRIGRLIAELRPTVIVSLGVAAGRSSIGLERVALNLDDSQAPDNAGEVRAGQLIVPDGPAAYWATLPLASLHDALAAAEIPVQISNHAGTFVCNHVFYTARHTVERLGLEAPCGFIHLPLMTEQADPETASEANLPLAQMVEAVACCLELLSGQAEVSPVARPSG